MGEMNFNEDDKKKFLEFLNTIAKTAQFSMNTVDIISYFKLLQYMQLTLLPKIDANILEVKRVVNIPEEEKEQPKVKGKK